MASSSVSQQRRRVLTIENLEVRQVLSASTSSLGELVTPNLIVEPEAHGARSHHRGDSQSRSSDSMLAAIDHYFATLDG
jgi:hypothetical protein